MDQVSLALEGAWKVLLVGLLLGAGLPAIFAMVGPLVTIPPAHRALGVWIPTRWNVVGHDSPSLLRPSPATANSGHPTGRG